MITSLHKRWLTISGNSYDAKRHKGIAELYVSDERFTAYYDKKVSGCARFLRDAIQHWFINAIRNKICLDTRKQFSVVQHLYRNYNGIEIVRQNFGFDIEGGITQVELNRYYICEKLIVPDFLGIKGDEMITVSSCFSGIHPDLTYCYFINDRKKERIEYRKNWDINEDKAFILQKDIHCMFQSRLAIDGRFSNLEDAKKICEDYFDTNRCVIVSVSTTEEYYRRMTDELTKNSSGINDFFPHVFDKNDLLGYDILGWDISGFHTFLCNGLHRESKLLKFNKHCLLENDFAVVESLAKQIQGKGEPVEWIPCRIGKYE